MKKSTKYTKRDPKRAKQMDAFIKAHELNGSNISLSCQSINIDRGTYYNWIEKYPDFKARVDTCIEKLYDFVESSIIKGIKDGNTAMTIFYAKTKMKSRGFVEKQEIEHSGYFSKPTEVTIRVDNGTNVDDEERSED